MTPLMPHAYYSEITQTLAAAVGFCLGIWAVWDARREEVFWRGVLEEEHQLGRSTDITSARYQIAKVQVASELATVVAQTVLLVIGVTGLFLPPPDWFSRALDPELIGIAISRYGMTTVTMILMFKSIIRRRGRINYNRARRRTDGEARQLSSPSAISALAMRHDC